MNQHTQSVLVMECCSDGEAADLQALVDAGYDLRVTRVREVDLESASRQALQQRTHLTIINDGGRAERGLSVLRELRKYLPAVPVLIHTPVPDLQCAVQSMREGAADYLAHSDGSHALLDSVQRYIRTAGDEPICFSPLGRESFDLAARVAATDVSVLITGESGTGKEIIAKHIHSCSNRRKGPFVAINCAAIPEHMLEATLFGHDKGAFTGAHKSRIGKFEQAAAGTLLLDEISEMPLELQAKLLRVLQERVIERVGENTVRPVDARVLATSNRDLKQQVQAGAFREDLYYRLGVFPIVLAPLRDRKEDVLPLVAHFLAKHAGSRGEIRLQGDAEAALLAAPWPGNVRELENIIQRALVLQSGAEIRAVDLGLGEISALASSDTSLGDQVKSVEHVVIQQAIDANAGSRREAAKALGISERTLRYKLQRMRENAGGK